MVFVTGLLRFLRKSNAVWVIIDRLMKTAYFLPMRASDFIDTLSRLYIWEIVKLHGASVSIVSGRDPRFISWFWQRLQSVFDTQLSFSTAFHPQTDG